MLRPLSVALLAAGAAALQLRGATIPSTTRKYFGPQRFALNATGAPFVVFSGERGARRLCEPALDGLAGAVVVFSPAGATMVDAQRCSTERMYLTAARAGALALIIVPVPFHLPGRHYFDHDGSTGELTGGGRMVLLDVAARHLARLLQNARDGDAPLVLAPTPNRWRAALVSWRFVLPARVLLPALCLATSLVALRNLRALRRNNGQWGRTAMILAIEAAVCASLAVVWALGGYGGGAWLSTSAARFFYTICGGWGMFNNLLCGLHWRSQKLWFALDADDAAARSPASKDAASPTGAAPDRRREALLLGALAIPTVGVDTLISVEAATYSGHVLARVRLYAIGLLVANYIASGAGPRARDGRG